jgi:hypothetical protein
MFNAVLMPSLLIPPAIGQPMQNRCRRIVTILSAGRGRRAWRVLPTLRFQLPRAGRSSKAFTAAVINELLQAKKLELSLQVFPRLGLDRAALAGPSIRASRPSPFSN